VARMSPAILKVRCDPFGRESGGPKRLLGGVYGPEYEGNHKWGCEREAMGRYRMICVCGHRGQPMPLCGPGLDRDVQGIAYWHPGHVAEFQKRASDSCPVCLFPPEARSRSAEIEIAQAELGTLEQIGYLNSPQARYLRGKVESGRTRMDELIEQRLVHKCPLTLTEIS
jgi:hypothetical protein